MAIHANVFPDRLQASASHVPRRRPRQLVRWEIPERKVFGPLENGGAIE